MAPGMHEARSAVALRDAQVTIVGLGLMGASLAAALKRAGACRQVIGAVRRPETAHAATERGWVDGVSTVLGESLARADLVVMATPVRAVIELLPTVGQLVKPGCTVMDLGSTKSEIVRAMSALPRGVGALGGHPMCGKETSGLDAADPELYEDQVFVLTPLERTDETTIALALELVQAIGSRPLVLSAEEHDQLVATVSHLPYVLASGLVATADKTAHASCALWQLASSGFRDTSRLAASNVEVMLDILLTNRAAVLARVRDFQAQVHRLAELLETANDTGLRDMLERVAARRRSLFG